MNAEVVLVLWGAAIVVAWTYGAAKGRAGTGLVLGLLLAWVGVGIVLFIRPAPDARDRS